MTTEELNKFGICKVTKLDIRRFFVPYYGEMVIPEHYTIENIFEKIYDKGMEDGINEGKIQKINEIKRCLDIEIND